jgi:hypothetical protein
MRTEWPLWDASLDALFEVGSKTHIGFGYEATGARWPVCLVFVYTKTKEK